MERRSSRRLGLNDATTISTKDGVFTGTLENISMGGFFLRTNKPIAPGDIIEVTIPLRNLGEKIIVNGTAIRIVDGGVAFKFENLDDDTYGALLYFTNSARA